MPFIDKTVMEQKVEFVFLAKTLNGFKFSVLCKRFNISRKVCMRQTNLTKRVFEEAKLRIE